ncbi:MAG: elongation factor Ts [Gammaproteobacteria bacterium SG8_47]|nr:MAG: elongation factor Ts [Gammaproteobacteria bacterium SG8_47]
MAAISAALVKELRERTGAGMMECKKALVETDGDLEAAIEHLRKTGQAKADKKAGRTAAEGRIAVAVSEDGKTAGMVEVNCETDFVANDDNFKAFAEAVAQRVLASRPDDAEALSGLALRDGEAATVEEERKALIAKLGENMAVRRCAVVESADQLGVYLHGNRIGVVVAVEGGDQTLAKDLAMHVAASRPICVSEEDVPADVLAKEREIFAAQAAESGKPAEIVAKMVDGRVNKYLKEVTLVGQPFVKDPDTSVEKLLKQAGAKVARFVRLEVGEGVEKKSEDFAAEVMAQVKGS